MNVYEEQLETIGNINYKRSTKFSHPSSIDSYYHGSAKDTQAEIIVRQVQIRNLQERQNIKVDVNKTTNLWNQKISYVLKIWTIHEDKENVEGNKNQDDCMYIGYETYICTFRDYLRNADSITDENFTSLLCDILELVRLVHLRSYVFMNFTLDNIIICSEDNRIKAKIIGLKEVCHVKMDDEKSFSNDINNLGNLIFSTICFDQDFNTELQKVKSFESYTDKFDCISNQMKNINWIKPHKKNFFVHFIIYLMVSKKCNHHTIAQFKRHPFFWEETDIEDFIRIINARLDIIEDDKNKVINKDRINKLCSKVVYTDFLEKLDPNVRKNMKKPQMDGVYNCSDLIRFIRNKIIHNDDDTDTENRKDASFPTLSESKLKKERELRELISFFDKHGGPLNYFLKTFPDLIYELFIYFRVLASHKKFKQFYFECILKDLPSYPKESSSLVQRPYHNSLSRNKKLKSDDQREKAMK